MKISFRSTVRSVYRHQPVVRTHKEGDNVVAETEDRGWFIALEGSYEGLFVGYEQPVTRTGKLIEPGMAAKVTLEIG